MEGLSERDIKDHLTSLQCLPTSDDLGEFPKDDLYFHTLVCRFWETFTFGDDEESFESSDGASSSDCDA